MFLIIMFCFKLNFERRAGLIYKFCLVGFVYVVMIHQPLSLAWGRGSLSYNSDLSVYVVEPISDVKLLPGSPVSKFPLVTNSDNDSITVKACRGEFEPASFVLRSSKDLNNVSVDASNLISSTGDLINSSEIDVRILKSWYQAGSDNIGIGDKALVPELLIKDDDLLLIDEEKEINYLRVNQEGRNKYIDITNKNLKFSKKDKIKDSDIILPFFLEKNINKQIWITFHVPKQQKSGTYRGTINIISDEIVLKKINVKLVVHKFYLSDPVIDYGIYYRGVIKYNHEVKDFDSDPKTWRQYEIEMENLLDHGVVYPTIYQGYVGLESALKIRKRVGFPLDRLYVLGISSRGVGERESVTSFSKRLRRWRAAIERNGFKSLYVYGHDEARGEKLLSQRNAWRAVHEEGAKNFVAGYKGASAIVGDLLDLHILAGNYKPKEVKKWHDLGKEVFIYAFPQAGLEMPNLYRRNYGIGLVCNGYDGAMNYAYQDSFGHIWNDFDHNKYKDHAFTYPITDGIIDTVQWEGFREAVDDVKYLSTLISLEGESAFKYICFYSSGEKNLNKIREKIVDRILNVLD